MGNLFWAIFLINQIFSVLCTQRYLLEYTWKADLVDVISGRILTYKGNRPWMVVGENHSFKTVIFDHYEVRGNLGFQFKYDTLEFSIQGRYGTRKARFVERRILHPTSIGETIKLRQAITTQQVSYIVEVSIRLEHYIE